MIKEISVVIWKELCAIKQRIKGILISLTFAAFLVFSTAMYKILLASRGNIQGGAFYVAGVMMFAGFIFTLKLWEERALKTIESLLSTPLSVRSVMIGKITASLLFGIGISLISVILFNIISGAWAGLKIPWPKIILIGLTPALFIFPIGLINGYAMWCLSKGSATVCQLLSMAIFFGAISTGWIGIKGPQILQVPTHFTFAMCGLLVILWLGGILSLALVDTEKIILNIPD